MPVPMRRIASSRGRMQRRAAAEALRIYWMTDIHYLHVNSNGDIVEDDPNAFQASLLQRQFWASGDKIQQFVADVNAARPDLVLHTGDMIEHTEQNIDPFLAYWTQIDPAIPWLVTISNHDLAGSVPDNDMYGLWRDALGYNVRPENARSVFNHSQSVVRADTGFAVRVITLDSSVQADGTHKNIADGAVLQQDALDWVDAELASCPEPIVLLAVHHGPQDYAAHGYWDLANAQALEAIVENRSTAGGLTVHALFGHNHDFDRAVHAYDSLGQQFKGYLGPPGVDEIPSAYAIANVFPDGSLWFETHDLRYPYP